MSEETQMRDALVVCAGRGSEVVFDELRVLAVICQLNLKSSRHAFGPSQKEVAVELGGDAWQEEKDKRLLGALARLLDSGLITHQIAQTQTAGDFAHRFKPKEGYRIMAQLTE